MPLTKEQLQLIRTPVEQLEAIFPVSSVDRHRTQPSLKRIPSEFLTLKQFELPKQAITSFSEVQRPFAEVCDLILSYSMLGKDLYTDVLTHKGRFKDLVLNQETTGYSNALLSATQIFFTEVLDQYPNLQPAFYAWLKEAPDIAGISHAFNISVGQLRSMRDGRGIALHSGALFMNQTEVNDLRICEGRRTATAILNAGEDIAINHQERFTDVKNSPIVESALTKTLEEHLSPREKQRRGIN